MNRTTAISIALLCTVLQVRAQDAPLYPAALEMDKAGAVWFNSGNAAGIILTPTASFETVDVGYDIADGEYRRYADGNTRTLGVNAEGAARLGRGRVWGEFSYDNITVNDSKYNTVFLNLDDDMPFYVADDIVSYWKKQRYDMAMKGATPLIHDRFALGVEASYFSESGAKQVDPRGYGYEYGLSVKPSAVVRFGRHSAGLTLTYENGNMRMSNINNALMSSHNAFVLKGLGNSEEYILSLLSSSSLGVVFDRKNEVGGALQYGYSSDGMRILAEIHGKYRDWELYQTPSKPKRIGTATRLSLGADLQAVLENGTFLQRITASGCMRNTQGIEYLQTLNRTYEVQAWETVGQNVKSTYSRIEASLDYDIFRKSACGYDWAAGFSASWNNLDDEYFLPSSDMKSGGIGAGAYFKKNFMAGKVSILPGVKLGCKKNLGTEYRYGGPNPESPVVTDLFPNTVAWMGADNMNCGADLSVSLPAFKSTMMYVKADWQLLAAFGAMSGMRNIASATVGFIF